MRVRLESLIYGLHVRTFLAAPQFTATGKAHDDLTDASSQAGKTGILGEKSARPHIEAMRVACILLTLYWLRKRLLCANNFPGTNATTASHLCVA